MATITKFEDLNIWKKSQELAASVYQLCEHNPVIAKDFGFKNQLKRAVLSISDNIAEGFEYNNNDFYRFLRIAKGSCTEVKNCVIFSVNTKLCTQQDAQALITLCTGLCQQIGELMKSVYLKSKTKKDKHRTN